MEDCTPHFQNSYSVSKLQLYAFKAFALCDQHMVVVAHTNNNNFIDREKGFSKAALMKAH